MDDNRIPALAGLAASLSVKGNGCAATDLAVPGVTVWRSHAPTAGEPALFDPRLYVVLQGRKTMTFAGTPQSMIPGMFALSSIGVPFVTSVDDASTDTPYLGVGVVLNPAEIAALIDQLPNWPKAAATSSIMIGTADHGLLSPIRRILEAARQPHDATILGPLIVRELLYRLLTGSAADTVRQLVSGSHRMDQVRRAVAILREAEGGMPKVEAVATQVGMSVTSLHRHFKALTGYGPIAYAKHLRLIAARAALLSGGTSVAQAARVAGYLSPSQFSREYKRKFAVPPRHDTR